MRGVLSYNLRVGLCRSKPTPIVAILIGSSSLPRGAAPTPRGGTRSIDHILRPVSSTTQIEVNFCDTSKPTNRAIAVSMCEPPSVLARTTAPWAPDASGHDYPMSTHDGRDPHLLLHGGRTPRGIAVGYAHSSRIARNRLSVIGLTRKLSIERLPLMTITSAGMPGSRTTPGLSFRASASISARIRKTGWLFASI